MAIELQAVVASTYILALTAAFVFLSHNYALPVFISELDSTPRSVKVAFSVTSGISFLVFFLVWAEFGQWIPSIRAVSWQISITSLLALMLVILPSMLNFSFFSESAGLANRFKYCFSIVALAAQLYVFYRIGYFLPEGEVASKSFLGACMLRVGFLGISAMALVSGFGAVSALWNVFVAKRIVSDFEVERLRQSIEVSHEQIEAKARLLNKMEVRQAEESGLFARLMGSSSTQEMEHVQKDLSNMQDLHNSLIADLTSAQAALDDQSRSRTSTGLVLKGLDVIFSVYCVYRIFATMYNLSPWKLESVDPISQLLALLVAHYDENIDKESWARMIGFLLSGIVIIGSLRACLLVLAKMSKSLPRVINQQSMALGFAILIGSYNIATAIVLCRNLPSAYGRNILSNLGASLEQSRFDVWFDSVFLLGVAGTTIILILQRKIAGMDDLSMDGEKRV